MALLAFAVPILPGKTTQWKHFAEELNGPRFREWEESRRRLGVHERVFLQTTPQGDMALVTVEGDNPEAALQSFGKGNDEFTRWFVQQVKECHGFDLSQGIPGQMPEFCCDSQKQMKKRTV